MIQHALSFYFSQTGLSEDAAAYEEGYRRQPERDTALEGYARAAAEVIGTEDWKVI